ncbi:MAG: hypothetical protein B7C24_11785 [Bacteroidetes bacterium 4572_77]|nr:MAG: hypothetical protein B7C24_11785 [Bacteroidetes bacterium 4572_77]
MIDTQFENIFPCLFFGIQKYYFHKNNHRIFIFFHELAIKICTFDFVFNEGHTRFNIKSVKKTLNIKD